MLAREQLPTKDLCISLGAPCFAFFAKRGKIRIVSLCHSEERLDEESAVQETSGCPMFRVLCETWEATDSDISLCHSEEHRDEESAKMPAYDGTDVRHKNRMFPRTSSCLPKLSSRAQPFFRRSEGSRADHHGLGFVEGHGFSRAEK